MTTIFYLWIAIGIVFLLVEIATTMFYGLSIAVAAFVVAGYAAYSGADSISVMQAVIFTVLSAVGCIVTPNLCNRVVKDSVKIGLDAAIGRTASLSKVGDDWKIKIDGVDYLVAESSVSEKFASRKKVVIDGHESGLVAVHLINE